MQPHLVLATINETERPMSIRALGAYAESIGIRTTLLVILKPLARIGAPVRFSESEVRQIAARLAREQVTHLGFYLMTASLRPYAALVQALRAAGYRGVILAGGVHASLCPAEALVAGADYAVQGPGETPLALLFANKDPASIPGLVWRQDGQIRVNPTTPEQKLELDSLPDPIFRFDRDWLLVDGKLQPLTWRKHVRHGSWGGRYYDLSTSRGCVYRCAYCCNVSGAPVRRASVDRVLRELRHLRERAPRIAGINIQDDSFYAGSDEWLDEFAARMKTEIGLPFIVRMIPRFVTRERIANLKAAGLAYVTMGLEGSDRMNQQIFTRRETAASYLKAARLILEAGVYMSTDLIIHNPYEKEEDLREVATTLNALPRPNWGVVALSLTPFPNTPLYARCVKDRLLDRFATDAYDAMLMPSRPGAYLTPRFWLLLNTQLLPHIPPAMGARLIAQGPNHPGAMQTVERLTTYFERTKRVTRWLRHKTPWLYSAAGRLLTRATRKHTTWRPTELLD